MPASGALDLNTMIETEFHGEIVSEKQTIRETGQPDRTVDVAIETVEYLFERPPEVLSFDISRAKPTVADPLYGNFDTRPIVVHEVFETEIRSPGESKKTKATYNLSTFRVYTGTGLSGHHYSYQRQEVTLPSGKTGVKYIMTNDATVEEVSQADFLAAAKQGVSFRFRLKK